jgi:HipA-like C-terminal domain
MNKLINFDKWVIDENTPFGSGASVKNWLINPITGERGVFKYPKMLPSGVYTGEYWAEKLAYQIAEVIGIESARVDIGTFNGRIGSMSYNTLKPNEALMEGIQYINMKYPNYSMDKLYDIVTMERYSISMIMESLKGTGLEKAFLMIPVYDALIGNTDRHHSNWAVIENKETQKIRLSPLYDNGSSLCSLVVDKPNHYMDDRQLHNFESLIYSKSTSVIRWDNEPKIRHFDMIKNISKKYYEETAELVNKIEKHFTDKRIIELVDGFDESIISETIKSLLKKFLIARRDRIVKIYNERVVCNNDR